MLRPAPAVDVSIVCLDLKTVEVTWGPAPAAGTNLSLEFRYGGHAPRPCPRYFLRGGLTSGCVVPMGKGLLEIALRGGGGATLFSRKRRASTWLKPRPPRNVTFYPTSDGVTVACPAHPYGGLDYEVQHRDSAFEDDWQTTSEPLCNVTVGGLDPWRCYDFRVRATPQDYYYGPEARPSDWTRVTHWRGAGPAASCSAVPARPRPSPLPLACGLATLVTLALLLALLRLRRVKEALLPCVPDPRGSFPGLFEKHHGNFQAWIAVDAQAAAPTAKPEDEDDDVIRPKGKEAEPDGDVTAPKSPCHAPRAPGGGTLVSVGGATFRVDDSGYMTL